MGWNYQRKTNRVMSPYPKRLHNFWRCGQWMVRRRYDNNQHYYTLEKPIGGWTAWKIVGVSDDVAFFLEGHKYSEKINRWLIKVEKETRKYDERSRKGRKGRNTKANSICLGSSGGVGEENEFAYYASYYLDDHPRTE